MGSIEPYIEKLRLGETEPNRGGNIDLGEHRLVLDPNLLSRKMLEKDNMNFIPIMEVHPWKKIYSHCLDRMLYSMLSHYDLK